MFATVSEFADFLGTTRPVEGSEEDRAARLILSLATAAVQDATQQRIHWVADDVVELAGTSEPDLWLPERPVESVASVALNGQALAAGSFQWSRGGELHKGPIAVANGSENSVVAGGWGGRRSIVRVTYSHGYQVIPDGIRAVVLQAAARAWTNPEGLAAERIAGYEASFAGSSGIVLTADETHALRRYRRRRASMVVRAA